MSASERETGTHHTDGRDPDVRVGADIGGTFTDVVLQRGEHRWSTKILTDHAAPERAILDGIRELADRAGIPLPSIAQVVHGTTLVTNALIERRGARVAFVTTRGFRDVIEMRSENRFEQYDLNLSLPEPLVPREDRLVIGERIAADGEVLLAIDEDELDALVERIAGGGFEAVAIGLLHAYANGAHERRVADAVRRRAPALFVSCSAQVSPRMRELERFNTVIANAYVQPRVADYLGRLQGSLRSAGIAAPVRMMHSGGGLIALDTAIEQPVRLLESGPAGGAVFAARCADAHGLNRVLSFDMGGTTAKICLIEDGRPSTSSTFEVARSYRFRKGSGTTVSTPVVDMVEIGAGGGSIAQRDRLGRIAVGPRSAGSEPGPACYGRGGTEPTVSDANLLLGRLSAEHFADGAIALDVSLAAGAVRRHLAVPDAGTATDADVATLAFGITELVDENMANAARVHAVESGRDIERFTMVAFGGGAPLHACRLCEKLGIDTLLIPVGAGVGSALGFLDAPVSCEAGRGLFQRLAAFDTAAVNALLGELEDEARRFVAAGVASAGTPVQASLTASMRYAGQGWEIPVALPLQPFDATAAVQLGDAFDAAYRALFGRTIDGLGVEVTNWSVTVASVVPAATGIERRTEGPVPGATTSRRLFDALQRTEVEARVVQRAGLAPGDTLPGPAVVVEPETSTIVTSAFTLTVQDDGSLLLRRRSPQSKPEPEPEPKIETGTGPRGTTVNRTGEIDLQVMWNRLIAVVEEQATTLVRTAFSTSVREAGDLSAGLFDRRGRMMAQAVTGTPGHVNAMAESVGHFVQAIGADDILEGDVYITNDPWLGTGHLHDVTVVTPVFRKAVHIGFFACTAHVVDIGGRGFGPDGNDVYEEGLQIPIMKLVDRGELSTVLMRIVRANVREPDQVVGDLHSLIACNAAGERRLADMLEEFGIDALEALSDFIVDTSLAATRRRIAALPPGAYPNTMRVDGFGAPVTMQVLLSVQGDRLLADFEGTSGQSGKGVNVPMVYTRAYACYGLKCAIAPDVPNNAGSLAPFEVVAPEGCILNAQRPAPVSVRHVLGHLVPDAVLGALHLCLPDTVPAEGASALWNIQIATRPVDGVAGRSGGEAGHEMLMFNSGGTGARPTLDGLSATAFPSGVSTMSVEATEQVGPIVVWRKELREGSGGAGRQRGGLGQVIEIEPRAGHEFHFNAMFDRIDHPARGRDGGGDGAPGRVGLADGTPLASKGRQKVSTGQRLVLELPGGGGHGSPSARSPEAVRRDLRAGYTLREPLDRDGGAITPSRNGS